MSNNLPVYIPRTGSLADRVLDYFRQAPEEELTQADIAHKFDVSRGSISACMETALSKGAVAYVQNDDLIWVYTLPKPQGTAKASKPKSDALASGADLGKALTRSVNEGAAPLRSRRGSIDLPPPCWISRPCRWSEACRSPARPTAALARANGRPCSTS